MTAEAALLAVLGTRAGRELPALPPTMLVAAHPDDETVGAGSRLPRLAQAHFVCVTDGAPRTGEDASRHGFTPAQYAQARRRELEAVLARCGIGAGRLLSLDCPDQQASLMLAASSERLAGLFADHGTQAVLTQSYEGGHPDHDATAFIVHAAAALLRARGRPAPAIVEMASYHRGPDGVRTCGFLPPPAGSESPPVMVSLTPQEEQLKADLIACFTTQRETLRGWPLQAEGFRPAPRYDFTGPPHAGKLHYEHYPWGMSGERFRSLAQEAMQQLGLEGRL
jgi:N-acetylglucosamine malate deacetylase 2